MMLAGNRNLEHSPTFLQHSLTDALTRISNPPPQSDPQYFKPIHHAFVIGGATLYTESLDFPPDSTSATFVDRVLLTRILEPAFERCDVFMPDFLPRIEPESSSEQSAEEQWVRTPHAELSDWVGFEVPEGVQEEKGVKYEFQMWVRRPQSAKAYI